MKFKTIQTSFFFGFLGLSTILFFWLIGNFIFPIFWAIFFTIIFYPIYQNILIKTKRKEILSSIITILLILTVIIVPISITGYLLVNEIPQINNNMLEKNTLDGILEKLPFKDSIDGLLIKNNIDPNNVETSIINSIRESLNSVGVQILFLGKNTLTLIINFFIMIYLIFFGLIDGKKYLLKLSKIIPLGDKTEKRLFEKFSSIVRSLFKGTLTVSTVQGLLGGILFLLVGINSVIIWTIVMIVAAMIPAVGIGIILFPTMLFFILIGNIATAIFILIGIAFITTIDNVLRPYLIGHETEIPDVLITLSILGGLLLFGMTGLVIGPVIAGFFLIMWHLFEEKYNENLNNDND